jgi:hypothetical protein
MFCPKCATQNPEGGSFCRSCGANISLIPQALSGNLQPAATDESCSGIGSRKRGNRLSLDHAFRNIFMGVAFLIVAIALSRSIGAAWWFWLLLPAFSMIGSGIAQYIRLKEQDRKNQLLSGPYNQIPAERYSPPKNLNSPVSGAELRAPVPSVTEGTTRHLRTEPATRHFDAEQK